MATIGTFTADKDGFTGTLRTLTLNVKAKLVPNDKGDNEHAPDYRVRLDSEDGPDAGPAWKDSSENAGEFVSMRLEGPIFPSPIRAKLFQSNDNPSVWTLRWKHARKIEDEE